MKDGSRASGLEVVGASAGSGKTFTITETVARAVDARQPGAILPDSLLGVTFTTRAADELASRIRRKLLENGEVDQAQRLPAAYLGTVHSVCFRLLQEYALDAGLVPGVEVLADGKSKHLRRIVEQTLPVELRDRMGALARSFKIEWDNQKGSSNWLFKVYEILDLMRGNDIAPERLAAMGTRAADELLALLPPPTDDDLDGRLERELEKAIADVEAAIDAGDTTDKTQKELAKMRGAARRVTEREWNDWPTLANLRPAKKTAPYVQALTKAAARFGEHPRFHADLRGFIEGLYLAAERALQEYSAWKKRKGVVDYIDMLQLALSLVDESAVAGDLKEKLSLVVVDEFQDTSPVQLSLFVKLHSLAGKSHWVGDRKQCIFEFAGADPRLMKQVLAWSRREGGTSRQLPKNYRSRPDLVRFCSKLFAGALASYGYESHEVAVEAHRVDSEALAALPPLGHWELAGSNQEVAAGALACGVQRLLSDPASTPILDRKTERVRPLKPGDIAVLVRDNQSARDLSDSLSGLGIRVAMPRPGLVSTPEGCLIIAGLSLLVDPRDRHSSALLDALHEWNGVGRAAWMVDRITAKANKEEPQLPSPWGERMAQVQKLSPEFSPREAVLAVMDALDAANLAARWPAPAQRLANLDALRALASEYEALCTSEGAACTLDGLLSYFYSAAEESWDGEEMTANDDQAYTEDEGAVVITTYHRSKGLEWPVVILSTLDKDPKADAFGIHLESDEPEFNPNAPLEGRWIRYWPNLFSSSKTAFHTAVAKHRYTEQATNEEMEERARLLYVGATRARDHLVFATRTAKKKGAPVWLWELADAEGAILSFEADHAVVRGQTPEDALRIPCRHWQLESATEHAAPPALPKPRLFTAHGNVRSEAPPYLVTPSSVEESWPEVPRPHLTRKVRLGEPLGLLKSGVDWGALGTALHGFLACDVQGLSQEERGRRAQRLMEALGQDQAVSAESAMLAGDRIREFVEKHYPDAIWHREARVDAVVPTDAGARRVGGTIDLLLETEKTLILIDHKSFPDPTESHLVAAAQSYAGQLGAYVAALACAHKKPVTECWIHFPIGGLMVGGSL